ESYAAKPGNAREVGVIGVAIFPERWYPPPRPQPLYPPPPAPWNGGLRGDLKGQQRGSPAPEAEQGAPATAPPASPLARKPAERPGLGTEFGEAVSSQVSEVPFERAHERPEAVIGVRYDDRAGVVAAGTGGALLVDGPTLSDQLHRSRESRGAGIHRLSLAVVDGSHRVADHGARHLIRVLELVLMDGLERREHHRHRRVVGGGIAERR